MSWYAFIAIFESNTLLTRMHSSRMCTIHFSGHLSCNTCLPTPHMPPPCTCPAMYALLPCTPPSMHALLPCTLCHTCHPAMHALHAMDAPYHACLPWPCMPPAIHIPLHTCTPAMHAPTMHVYHGHACPLPCMPPTTHLPTILAKLPMNRITDRCKNITFLQLRLRQ